MGRVLVIEDNQCSAKIIMKIIKDTDNQLDVLWADNASRAYEMAMEYKIDLFLVDIVLESGTARDVSGLSFARNIRKIAQYKITPLIIISSKKVSKIDLFQTVHCYSIMEKPICDNELREILENIFHNNAPNTGKEYLDFRVNGIIYPVCINQIVYIEHSRGDLYIHTSKDVLRVPYYSLKEIERKTDGIFWRCSKTTLINKEYIHELDFTNCYVRLTDGYGQLEIGSVMKKRIRNRINSLKLAE
ncbi:MAG: LytTR family transcriptional regulator DNA-binding domain-containing protein [Clostridiaceae bacterium]|nr:LytTR family transcriptional regulator DNA-binding domain-containing protein [Clostridiaceae bacterium]